jgi:non-homologous end joining protein Ku
VISAEAGVLILRTIPFLNEIRVASKQEREHFKSKVDQRTVDKMTELLREVQNKNGFQYAAYSDDGLKLRSAAVDRIVAGQKPEQLEQPEDQPEQVDVFAALEAALAGVKQ